MQSRAPSLLVLVLGGKPWMSAEVVAKGEVARDGLKRRAGVGMELYSSATAYGIVFGAVASAGEPILAPPSVAQAFYGLAMRVEGDEIADHKQQIEDRLGANFRYGGRAEMVDVAQH